MKRCATCKEIKESQCFSKHRRQKDGLYFRCKDCVRQHRLDNIEILTERSRRYKKENRSKILEASKLYHMTHKEQEKLYRNKRKDIKKEYDKKHRVEYYQERKTYFKEKARKYNLENKEKIKERISKYRAAKPWINRAIVAKYRAAKRRATPTWSDLKAIKEFYKNCPKGYHVDHEIPLQGKEVSGLHVLNNLQYLPALENIAKGNRLKGV